MDYAEIATDVVTLIVDAGRDVTIVRYRQTPADASKPWRGPTDPTTTPDATTTVRAVAAASGLGFKALDKDLMKRASEFYLVGPGATFDLTTANEVIDGGVHKRIEFVELLKPANTVLLYIVGVSR